MNETSASHPDADGQIQQRREGREFILEARQWLPAEPERVWRFVSDCRHMNHVIPRFMSFQILPADDPAPPRPLAPEVTYEYRLKLHGIAVFWRTRIKEVDRPRYFRDIQEKGPYARFSHEHRFEPVDGGTLAHDLIRYRPPGGILAPLIDRLYVGPSLRRLFENRHRRMRQLFADDADPSRLFTAATASDLEDHPGGPASPDG